METFRGSKAFSINSFSTTQWSDIGDAEQTGTVAGFEITHTLADMAFDGSDVHELLNKLGGPLADNQAANALNFADIPTFSPTFRLGNEILVNTATAGLQTESRMVALTGGGFVVVWQDGSLGVGGATGDSTGTAIKAQLFDASGVKIGSEILVNSATAGDQNNARVTALTGGGFAVTWVDASTGVGGTGGDTSGTAIKAQIFDATGARTGIELLVNTTTTGSQNSQQIVSLSNGGFVVCWADSFNSIKTQTFSAGGAKIGVEQIASNPLAGGTQVPQITALTNGGYVVTWFEVRPGGGGDNDSFRISAQIFDSSGAKVGSDILVNTATASSQFDPVVKPLANGSFVITWSDFSLGVGGAAGDTDSAAIKGQIFDSTGARTGSEFLVNTATAGFQQYSQIATLTGGGFVVLWADASAGVGGATGDSSGTALKAQLFGNDGSRIGNEILVNSTTSGDQGGLGRQMIIPLSDGGFAVIWTDAGSAIRMQSFDATGTKVGGELLVNTATGTHLAPQFAELANGDVAASWTNISGLGGATGDSSSGAIKLQIIGANNAPTGLDGSINFYEDALLTLNDPVYFGYNDADGNPFGGVWIDGTSGSGAFTLGGVAITAPIFVTAAQVTGGQLRFTPAANVSGNNYAAFTFRVSDSLGAVDPVANTRALNILPVNDAPVADLNGAAAGINTIGNYAEGSAPIRPLQNLALSDVDSAVLTGATVTIASGFVAGDLLRGSLGLSGTTASGITYSYNSGTGVLTLSGNASVAAYQAELAALSFKSNSDNPGIARTISVVVNDGSLASSLANIFLTVSPVNDAPINSVPGAQVGSSGQPLIFSAGNGNALTIGDADAGAGVMRVRLSVDSGTLSLGSTAGLIVTGNGTGLIKVTGTLAAINNALSGLTYQSSPGDTGPATLTISTSDGGNNGSGGSLTDTDSILIQWQAPAAAEPTSKHLMESQDDTVSAAFAPADAGSFAAGDAADLSGKITRPAGFGSEAVPGAAFWV